MSHSARRTVWSAAAAGLTWLAACHGDDALTAGNGDTGLISGQVSWSGGPMAEPLTITAASGSPISIMSDPLTGAYGPVAVPVGPVRVALNDAPGGCTLPAARIDTVLSGATATLDLGFDPCSPNVYGQLLSSTTGGLAGVQLNMLVDGAAQFSWPTDSGGNFTALATPTGGGTAPLEFTVASGLPANCSAPNPATVSLAAGSTLSLHLQVDCTP